MAVNQRRKKIIAIVIAIAILIPLILEIGVLIRSSYSAYLPDYEKTDIRPILMKPELSEADYRELFLQTGLTRLGVDGLLENGLASKILKIQDQYFEKQSYRLNSFAPFTGYLRRDEAPIVTEFAVLENGDILYSPTTFLSFIRLGHTSLMVDSSRGYMAQASGYSSPVQLINIAHFFSRPAFVILRPKENVGEAVAEYTKTELLGVRYSILAGLFGEKAPKTLSSTHCAHFIWYAYMQEEIDLDSDGGKIITPDDILYSENLSVVQIYGIAPDKIFKD